MQNKVFLARKERKLTPLQIMYVDAYFDRKGNMGLIAADIERTLEHACNIGKSKHVQQHIAKRMKNGTVYNKGVEFIVSKPERIEILWGIAQKGVELIYDKEGNQVMSSPATSVSAVRTINEMVAGSLAPKEVEVTVKDDTRTEAEIRANIARLTKQYNELSVIEGVTDDDVAKTRELPKVVLSAEQERG